jgi:hypothetical protein
MGRNLHWSIVLAALFLGQLNIGLVGPAHAPLKSLGFWAGQVFKSGLLRRVNLVARIPCAGKPQNPSALPQVSATL